MRFRASTGVGFGGLSVRLAKKCVRDGRVGRDNGLSVKMLLSPSMGEFGGANGNRLSDFDQILTTASGKDVSLVDGVCQLMGV